MAALENVLLGKIFISHSSKDKKFVRRLVSKLEATGYSVWLDERELHVGDQLAKSIAEAIAGARVVVVVISEASLRSNWLRYELNHATEMMIKGKCRLIPVLIGPVEAPPEIGGMLYADFRGSFERGLAKVLDTLGHECERYASEMGFCAEIERLLAEEFGGAGSGAIMSEYKSVDYSYFVVEGGRHIVYEIVSAYGDPPEPLSDRWWEEYSEALAQVGERFALLVSERPIAFPVDSYVEGTDKRMALVTTMRIYVEVDEILVIVIDMSGQPETSRRRELLRRAKQVVERAE